jgi:uncharacterized membrane protein (UPF0182 family)
METEKYLSYSLGFIFLFFGTLKLFGENSIQGLVSETVFLLPTDIVMPVLAIWEIAIGVCFLYRPLKKAGLILLLPHMAGTFLPLLVAPELVITSSGLTLEGHYIVKNVVLLAAAFQVQDDEFLSSITERLSR